MGDNAWKRRQDRETSSFFRRKPHLDKHQCHHSNVVKYNRLLAWKAGECAENLLEELGPGSPDACVNGALAQLLRPRVNVPENGMAQTWNPLLPCP
jgi:hypothetical protein